MQTLLQGEGICDTKLPVNMIRIIRLQFSGLIVLCHSQSRRQRASRPSSWLLNYSICIPESVICHVCLIIILSLHLLSCLIIPEHVSVLLSHVTQLPIGYSGFSLPSNLTASFTIISPHPCIHNINLLNNTNGCQLGFLTNPLTY